MKWVETIHCTSFAHCRTCRDREGGREWRENIAQEFDVPTIDWDCPYGAKWDIANTWWRRCRRKYKFGSKIEAIIQTTGIRPCRGCGKRKRYLDGA